MRDYWKYVRKGKVDECWLWKGPANPLYRGKQRSPRRIIWSLHTKKCLRSDVFVWVTCGNLACVNPNHLKAATQQNRPIADTTERRFWSFVKKPDKSERGEDDDCWIWTGSEKAHEYGYGKLAVSGKSQQDYAHRISWWLHYGKIPDGLCVLHHCDNPRCVRPDHLFLGTIEDNMVDAASKKRTGFQLYPEKIERGEQRYCAKLTADLVVEIRKRHIEGVSNNQMAREYGVNCGTVSNVVNRKRWKHIA